MRWNFLPNDLETALGELMRVDEIWINELVTYQNLYGTLERILRLKREQGAKILMLLHDFLCSLSGSEPDRCEGKILRRSILRCLRQMCSGQPQQCMHRVWKWNSLAYKIPGIPVKL